MTVKFNLEKNYESGNWTDEVADLFNTLKRIEDPTLFNFIVKVLSEKPNNTYTEEALRSLKFFKTRMQEDSHHEKIIDSIQHIVEDTKISETIRERAIMELGNIGSWPNKTLRNILEFETDRYMKIFAFRAILTQLKLPYEVIDTEIEKAYENQIEPSFHEINRITQARADGAYDNLVS